VLVIQRLERRDFAMSDTFDESVGIHEIAVRLSIRMTSIP